ncbi:MAG: hypothetical protein ABW171_13790 [Steroidobacter sp.]
MKMFRPIPAALAAMTTSCLFMGLLAAFPSHAEADDKALNSCREEVWRVSVVTKAGNPKHTSLPRYQKRTVLVCDEKVFAEIQSEARERDGV